MTPATATLRGEPARRAILEMVDALADWGVSPSQDDLARHLRLQRSSVRWHLAKLRDAGYLAPDNPIRRPSSKLDNSR